MRLGSIRASTLAVAVSQALQRQVSDSMSVLTESDADIAAGRTVSYEQVKQDLGSQTG